MLRYTYNPSEKRSAKAQGLNLDISLKDAIKVCRAINHLHYKKGLALLEGLLEKTRDLNGKYYTKTVMHILDILESAKNNADFKGLDEDKLHIHASAHKGFETYTGRRFKLRRRARKYTHIQIVLEER